MAPRVVGKLKALQVERAKVPGYLSDGGGLYLQVSPTLSKSWIFRYTLGGKSREMGLGPCHAIGLADARKRAKSARELLVDRLDPIAARDAQRAAEKAARAEAVDFKSCAENYVRAFKTEWKSSKHAGQWSTTLKTYVYPEFGSVMVSDVTRAHVVAALEPIWIEVPETASRVRGRIEKILDWAKGKGLRTGDNPAAWKGNLESLLPKPKRASRIVNHPALPYDQVASFMASLRAVDGLSARALELTILTAARTREVIEARWEEIDLAKHLWIIPKARMKAGKEHRIPLSDRAIEILKALPKVSDFLFPSPRGDKPMSNMAMLQVLKRMDRSDVTVHGFRSSFRDWTAEQTAYPREVCEHALAHGLKDATEAAYQRGDLLRKRTALMEDWAKYCSTLQKQGSRVTPIRRSKTAA